MRVAEEGDRRAHFEPPPGLANQTFGGEEGGMGWPKDGAAPLRRSDQAQQIGHGPGTDQRTPEPSDIWISGQETIVRSGPYARRYRWPLPGCRSQSADSVRTDGSSRWRTGIATGAFGRC